MKKQAGIIFAIALVVLIGAGLVLRAALDAAGVLADLVAVQGAAERQSNASAPQWSSASVADRFRLGDALRTGPASIARVRMRAGSGLELRPNTTVRFSASRPGSSAPSLRVERGEVQVQAEQPMAVATERGYVRVERGARVRFTVEDGTMRVRVDLGRAVVEREGLSAEVLVAGSAAEVPAELPANAPPRRPARRDAAVPSPDPIAPAPDAPDASSASSAVEDAGEAPTSDAGEAPQPDPSTTAGPIGSADETSSGPADLVLAAGASAALHAPELPVRVQLEFSSLCNGGAARFTGFGRANGEPRSTALIVALRAGRYAYRVRCEVGGASARGALSVDGATASAALPARPPRSDVEVDGHAYTVHYQNLLPILRVSWPHAPASAAGYALHIRDARGRDSVVSSRTPTVELASGQLAEGTHRVRMQALTGSSRSPETPVTVAFDNAASAVQIREPRPGASFGATVRVEGSALLGSSVSVGDTALPLDAQRRFSATVTLTGPSLVVTIRHRSRGTQYYVRRAASSP